MKFTVEAAVLSDAVTRASRVAPSKGAAFDKAAGVVIELHPDTLEPHLVIRATDLESTFTQRVRVESMDADEAVWRAPSSLLAGLLASLPMGNGKTVTLADRASKGEPDGHIRVLAGKTKARVRIYDQPFAFQFPDIDRSLLTVVPNIAQRIEQVAWAVAKENDDILGGIHIDGTSLLACDRQTLVDVPCVVPLDNPITAPLSALAVLLKNTGDVSIHATDQHLFLSIDEDTLMSTVLYAGSYPGVRKIQRTDHTGTAIVEKSDVVNAIQRMLVMVKGERYPIMKLQVLVDSIIVSIDDPDTGHIEDELEATVTGDPITMWFTPLKIVSALEGASEARVELSYGPSDRQAIMLKSKDYRCDLMPRAPEAAQVASGAAA